jgi:hypothetical protein
MRVKGDDNTLGIETMGHGAKLRQQNTMSAMHTIKRTDGNNSSYILGNVIETEIYLHS